MGRIINTAKKRRNSSILKNRLGNVVKEDKEISKEVFKRPSKTKERQVGTTEVKQRTVAVMNDGRGNVVVLGLVVAALLFAAYLYFFL